MAWRWAAASVIGTSHIRSGEGLQDAYDVSVFGSDHVFAAVLDGAGSAQFGRQGAWVVCRGLKIRFRDWLARNRELPDEKTLRCWIDDLRDRIADVAERRGSEPRQFATTLTALLVSPEELLALQIGDSSVVGRRGPDWDVICWPDNGEYASSTYFVTDDPEVRLRIVRQVREHDAFALFSDGVGGLALSHEEETAHPGFFNPMIRPVDASQGTGRLPELSAKLGAYLAGPAVCERTDDDKTLVLLSTA